MDGSTNGSWRIFEVGADGTGLRQITTSDRQANLDRYGELGATFETYDDLDPTYLPDGRIVFVSTRHPGFAPASRLRSTNLFVVNEDGSDVHRITTERFGADTPEVHPTTGQVVYSRWWLTAQSHPSAFGGLPPGVTAPYYTPQAVGFTPGTFGVEVAGELRDAQFTGVNTWFLSAINPDGSGLSMLSGFGLNRQLGMAYRPSFTSTGEVLTLFVLSSPILGYPGAHGIRITEGSMALPRGLDGPQTFFGDASFPDPSPSFITPSSKSPKHFYSSATELPSGNLLVTARPAPDDPRDPGPDDRDIYVIERLESGDFASDPHYLFGAEDRMELDAVPLVARAVPPIVEDSKPYLKQLDAPTSPEEAASVNGTFSFECENIFANGPLDSPMANAPPVGLDMSIEFYMNHERGGGTKPEPPILIARQEIPVDGKIQMDLPAGVPLFEVLRNSNGNIVRGRDGQPFHVGGMNYGVAGDTARCVGCHSGHSSLPVPENDVEWTNLAPSARVEASPNTPTLHNLINIFRPQTVVDRRTDLVISEWAASVDDKNPVIELHWDAALRAREAIVYGVRTDEAFFHPRSLSISKFTLSTFYLGDKVEEIDGTTIASDGVRVPLDAERPITSLTVSINPADVRGTIAGLNVAALAEIEVVARVDGDAAQPTRAFIRGDVDCSQRTDITDSLRLLQGLFLGLPFCCKAAADVDSSGNLDITDSVNLLVWMFLGQSKPQAPYPDCGHGTGPGAGQHTCDASTCF
jgi:hypothetical protein